MIAKIKIPEQKVEQYQFDALKKVCNSVRLKDTSDYYHYGDLPDGKTKEDVIKDKFNDEHKNIFGIIKDDYSSNHIVDIVLLMNNCSWLRFEVLETVMSYQNSTPEMLIHKFYDMSERLNATVDKYNERCNVHIGGQSLMQINRVEVKTDFCTEALQDEIDKGWRILAVCVQPDGRRPDYVLGKIEIQ